MRVEDKKWVKRMGQDLWLGSAWDWVRVGEGLRCSGGPGELGLRVGLGDRSVEFGL